MDPPIVLSEAISAYHRVKFSEQVHDYIREHIRNADQKAAFFFAAVAALLAFLQSEKATARWVKDVRTWSAVDFLAFLSMAGLALSAAVFFAVVFPRLRGLKRGFLFFAAIAEHPSGSEYAREVLQLPDAELTRACLQHSYDLSRVCFAKYRLLSIGCWIAGASILCTFLYLFCT